MSWTVSASGKKDEAKASIQKQATHPGIHGPLCALVDSLEGTRVSLSASGSGTSVSVTISGWTGEGDLEEAEAA
jgi:hypothetical protein